MEQLGSPNWARADPFDRSVDAPLGEAVEELLEGHPSFQPRQRSAEAVVDAMSERDGARDLAVDVELVGPLVLALLEARVAFEELLDRFPEWSIDRPVEWIRSGPVRGPERLHVALGT